MALETKVIYDTNSGFTNPTTITKNGQPQNVSLQGLSANTGHYVKAEIWRDGGLQNTSSIETFTTLPVGVITLTHDQTVRRGYAYDVTYAYTSTYAPAYSTLSTNGSTFQGVIDSANSKVTFTVTGLTSGNAYLTEVEMGDIYGESATVQGTIVATVVNEITIVDTEAKSTEVDIAVEYVVDGGFYAGYVDYWYSTDDPSTDPALGRVSFNDGETLVTVDNLTNSTAYKFRAGMTLGDETTNIYSNVVVTTPVDFSSEYFTIVNVSGQSNTISYTCNRDPVVGMEVSTDGGTTWSQITPAISGTLAVLSSGGEVMMKHTGALGNYSQRFNIVSTGLISARGNIASLTHGSDFIGTKTMPDYAFYGLFSDNTKLVDASEVSFSSFRETSSHGCEFMFAYCIRLRFPPAELSMNGVGAYGYAYMLRGCTSLINAPELPSTSLGEHCYYMMFHDCTSLTTAPELPSTSLASYCYSYMFYRCTSLIYTPRLRATNMVDNCYYGMFNGCSSMTRPSALPSTSLAYYCYAQMFKDCTSLESAPSLPATLLYERCYYEMFRGCSSLRTAPTLNATTLHKGCYESMFMYCTSLTTAPSLPVTSLRESCYSTMFKGCTSLTTAPTLSATTLINACYKSMFEECTSLTTAPNLPATSLVSSCYNNMFRSCTALVTPPSLKHVTSWAVRSMQYMFRNCTSLDVAYAPSVSIWNTSYADNWLLDTAASGTVYKPADLDIPDDNPDGVPVGWTTQDYQ